jgi:gamma-glutamyl:cysteine ligase YbdK (ATP-grasp superfamily)
MTDETLADAPDTIEETTDLQAPVEVQPEATSDTPEAPVEDDLEEFEWEGKPVRGPKGLKDGVLRLSDYTRKTQEVAAQRREIEERATRLQETAKLTDEEMGYRVQLRQIDTALEQYGKWTAQQWQQLKESDPQAWTEHRFQLNELHAARPRLAGQISEAETKRTREAQTVTSKRIEQAEEYAASKGWTADKLKKVIDFAVLHGVSEHKMEQQAIAAMLQSNMSPLMLDLLDAAQYGAEVRKAQKTKPLGTKPAPLETVGGKSNPSSKKSLEEMDMDEYVAARKAGRKV